MAYYVELGYWDEGYTDDNIVEVSTASFSLSSYDHRINEKTRVAIFPTGWYQTNFRSVLILRSDGADVQNTIEFAFTGNDHTINCAEIVEVSLLAFTLTYNEHAANAKFVQPVDAVTFTLSTQQPNINETFRPATLVAQVTTNDVTINERDVVDLSALQVSFSTQTTIVSADDNVAIDKLSFAATFRNVLTSADDNVEADNTYQFVFTANETKVSIDVTVSVDTFTFAKQFNPVIIDEVFNVDTRQFVLNYSSVNLGDVVYPTTLSFTTDFKEVTPRDTVQIGVVGFNLNHRVHSIIRAGRVLFEGPNISSMSRSNTDIHGWTKVTGVGQPAMFGIANNKLYGKGFSAYLGIGANEADISNVDWTPIAENQNWTDVLSLHSAGCATRADGTLWSWGSNLDGRTALGTTVGTTASPTQVGSINTWTKLSNTPNNGLAGAINGSNNRSYGWGGNGGSGIEFLGLDYGGSIPSNAPVLTPQLRPTVPAPTSLLTQAVPSGAAIASGDGFWGWGVFYQDVTTGTFFPSPTKFGAGFNWTDVYTGNFTTFTRLIALRADKQLHRFNTVFTDPTAVQLQRFGSFLWDRIYSAAGTRFIALRDNGVSYQYTGLSLVATTSDKWLELYTAGFSDLVYGIKYAPVVDGPPAHVVITTDTLQFTTDFKTTSIDEVIDVDTLALSLTTNDVDARIIHRVAVDAEQFNLTHNDPSINESVIPATQAINVTFEEVQVNARELVSTNVLEFNLEFQFGEIVGSDTIRPATASYLWASNEHQINARTRVDVDTATFSLTTNDPSIHVSVIPATRQFTFTANDIVANEENFVTVDQIAYTLEFAEAQLNVTVNVDAASYTLTTYDITANEENFIEVATAQFNTTYNEANINARYVAAIDQLAYNFEFSAATVNEVFVQPVDGFSVTIAFNDVNVSADFNVPAEAMEIAIVTNDVTVNAREVVAVDSLTIAITSNAHVINERYVEPINNTVAYTLATYDPRVGIDVTERPETIRYNFEWFGGITTRDVLPGEAIYTSVITYGWRAVDSGEPFVAIAVRTVQQSGSRFKLVQKQTWSVGEEGIQ